MTRENKKQFKQEIENILLTNESNYIFDKIYEDAFGVHIVIKRKCSWSIYYFDICVSLEQVRHYYKEDGAIHEDSVFYMDEIKLCFDIINWWYK